MKLKSMLVGAAALLLAIASGSGVSSITIPGPAGNLFFRLSQP